MMILILLIVIFVLSIKLVVDKFCYAREKEIKALMYEAEVARCKFFNDTLSSDMTQEKDLNPQTLYVDKDPGPVKWIKRDSEA